MWCLSGNSRDPIKKGKKSFEHDSVANFLQIDFNLFGMGFLRLDEALFRSPIPDANFPRRAGWKEAESIVHHETSPSGGIDPEFTQERRFLFRKLDKSKSRYNHMRLCRIA